MSILVTGGTGHTGRHLVEGLAAEGADVTVLTRSPESHALPPGATALRGALGDIDLMRSALSKASTLFLLAPNTADELHVTLTVLNLAKDMGTRGVVYLSVYECEKHPRVPHFACKVAAERLIESCGMPATILRPTVFMQNDLQLRQPLLEQGVYPSPIGQKGVALVDVRDIAELACSELMRRERSSEPLPLERFDLIGPDNLSADDIAAIWSRALGRKVVYGGDDLDAFESAICGLVPPEFAYDLRVMYEAFQQRGGTASAAQLAAVTAALGHAPRSYEDFVAEAVASWTKA
jgi:uncharacterized protein YbjT (DUF2867 family)